MLLWLFKVASLEVASFGSFSYEKYFLEDSGMLEEYHCIKLNSGDDRPKPKKICISFLLLP